MSTPTCTNCGLPNAPNAAACARCGAPLAAPAPTSWAPPPPFAPPPPPKGRSTAATVAIVLAVVLIFGVAVVGIVAAIVIPSLIKARAAANEASAIGTLRMLASAEAAYDSEHREYGRLRDLAREGLVDPNFADGMERHGVRFRDVRASSTGFEIAAEPTGDLTSPSRSYNIIEDFVIRYAEGTTAPRGTSGKILGS